MDCVAFVPPVEDGQSGPRDIQYMPVPPPHHARSDGNPNTIPDRIVASTNSLPKRQIGFLNRREYSSQLRFR